MTLQCIFCKDLIELNEDSDAARKSGTDPHQQLRQHLNKHPREAFKFVQEIGWLIDWLAFSPVDQVDAERYRRHRQQLLVYFSKADPL